MIVLEPFAEEDFQRLISWIDDRKSLVLFAGTIFEFPLTEVQLQRYLEEKDRTAFRVREQQSGKIIGHAEMLRVEGNMIRLCRILVGEQEFRGRGFGREIVSLLLKQAFAFPEVEVVELNVYEQNHSARRCYERAGFKENPPKNKITNVGDETWLSLNMLIPRKNFRS